MNRQAFPVDEWALVQSDEGATNDAHDTLFAISNGVFGLRTPIGGKQSVARATTIVNRFYETFDITYPEDAYGLARIGQSLVPGPDFSFVEIEIDEHCYQLDSAPWSRTLDFKTGSLKREFRFPLRSTATARVTHTTFVSQVMPQQAFHRWVVEVENSDLPHAVSLIAHVRHLDDVPSSDRDNDPRQGRRFFGDEAPVCELTPVPDGFMSKITTRRSQQQLRTSLRSLSTACQAQLDSPSSTSGALIVRGHSSREQPFETSLALSVSHGSISDDWASAPDFDTAFAEHAEIVKSFWSRADIRVTGDPERQQAVRWHLFQLFQASPPIDGIGISAKGQTALGYDGHYFWDTEVFMLPFFSHTNPARARRLLEVRHEMLPQARTRAATMSQKGALFPWRTLNGEEASAYYPAGTAQYHINADISWAIHHYWLATGDQDFSTSAGQEIAIETARLWADFAFEDADGRWHLHGVTGPDEYSAVVDDNAYTNAMAARNLRFAAQLADDSFHSAFDIPATEIENWRRIADGLVIPFDHEHGIYAQDAHFLSRRRWELSEIPEDQHPLLLHVHPLVIYRHQIIKQADVVLAMLLAPEAFNREVLEDTFMYYEGVTTGDSSLSAAIQATAAASVGQNERADEHLQQALLLDLANTHDNTADGVHLANSGGIWTAIVVGMAGISLRDDGVNIAPTGWCVGDEVNVLLPFRSSLLGLNLRRDGTTVELKLGPPISLRTPDHEVLLQTEPIFVPAVFPSTMQGG